MGEHGTLLKTTNGGIEWVQKKTGTIKGLWNSYFINSQTGWIAGGAESGNSGVLLKTTDNGETWREVLTGITNRWFTGICFPNSQTGYLIGEHGTVLKTTDFGVSWDSSNAGISNILLESISFTDQNTGWITGWNGILFKTTNGGNAWIPLNSGVSFNLYTSYFFSSNIGCISGSGGTVLKTKNGGLNWTAMPSGTTQEIFSIFFHGNNGWIAGHQGTVRFTTDYGNTWSAGIIGTTTRLEAIHFISSLTGWVVGGYFGSVVYKSTDGGANWFAQNANSIEKFYSVNFPDSLVGGIEPVNTAVPAGYELYQNYPNPFNPVTKVRFDVPNNYGSLQNIDLKIYSEIGEEVATLLDRKLSPGTYEVDWDASKYGSGIYFCRMQSENFTKTIRMSLIK
jgi:photosystem II stability/assembly factor-like uncharacterized protein